MMLATSDLFNFEKLKLIDKPNCPSNAEFLPLDLVGCEGFLRNLPLKAPNVDQKVATTIQDMVNILTDPHAAASFAEAEARQTYVDTRPVEGSPSPTYDYASSDVMKDHLRIVKKNTSHVKAPGVAGHIVLPGHISFYKRDGKTFAVTEGRWLLMSYKAAWTTKLTTLNQDVIAPMGTQVLIIRVPPGSVGRIRDQGTEVLLDSGTHVFNSGQVVNVGTVAYAEYTHINHGRYHYIRVPRGKFGKVWVEVKNSNGINKSVQPRLLQQGEHFIDSYLFQFVVGMVDVATTYISHGSIHRISVDKGKVAKVWHDNLPRLLGEGDHIVESTQFRFEGMESIIANPCIVHGTLTILRVTRGQIALVWKDNEPTFIDIPGLYEFDSPDFTFAEFKDAEEPYIQLGSKKTILVQTGQVGVTYLEGQLKILPNGRHVIDLATHIFNHFLSTQQKSIRLATLNASEKLALKPSASKTSRGKEKDWKASEKPVHPDADLTICETKDLVKVGLRADVFYSIEDPEKCILKIDTDELEDLVRETAVATLTNIIRSTALNQIAQSKAVSAGSESVLSVFQPPGTDGHPPASAPTAIFFERVHDEFLYKLHDDFMHRYGVDIANIRIESFKIMDEELSDQISKHALTTAQIENEMANLEGKALISTTEERTSAEVKIISAEAEAASMKTRTDAENKRKIDAAKALAEAHKISVQAKAEAEAAAILLKAKAEAEAISLKAHAEAQRAELLSKTTLGMQESLLAQYSQMVIESNRGVEKVVYLDPSVNRDSPFALGSLQNLNLDLHSLSQLGVAVDQAGWNGNGNGPVKKGSSSAMVQK